jgi:hypothetical protein
MQTLDAQAAAIGKNMQYLLSRLRINVPAFVAMIEGTMSGTSEPHDPSAL